MEVAKITRALDRNIERKAVDLARVAMIGLSYRGYYNLYIATVEPRIEGTEPRERRCPEKPKPGDRS